MASIHITEFAGLLPDLNSTLKPKANAQVAHNCLLTDGSLRPYPQWVELREFYVSSGEGGDATLRSLVYDPLSDTAFAYPHRDSVSLSGAPFANRVTVGVASVPDGGYQIPTVDTSSTGDSLNYIPAGIPCRAYSGSVTYERSYDSYKPVNRMYAASRVRKRYGVAAESALALIPGQDSKGEHYEGDQVTVTFTLYTEYDEATHVRLYRSISGLDTGQAITNTLDTEWFLVAEFVGVGGAKTYVDGASAAKLPLDVYYAHQFHPISIQPAYFGLTESGWFVAADKLGHISVSERYMHHAYPPENYFTIPEKITDMAVHRDNVYVGTDSVPYVVAISAGDKAMQGAVRQYDESIACLPGSMAASASGAIYASTEGLVALGREGMQILTANVANAGDELYSKVILDNVSYNEKTVRAAIGSTSYGAYYRGKYYGFCVPIAEPEIVLS